jgi:hypothetical protein
MELKSVILETLMMMGFTFIVGMAVAYAIRLLVAIFLFFSKRDVVKESKAYVKNGPKRLSKIRTAMHLLEKMSDVELLKYVYENKNKYDPEEKVEDLYSISRFYNGTGRDPKDHDDTNELIKFYHGEV